MDSIIDMNHMIRWGTVKTKVKKRMNAVAVVILYRSA